MNLQEFPDQLKTWAAALRRMTFFRIPNEIGAFSAGPPGRPQYRGCHVVRLGPYGMCLASYRHRVAIPLHSRPSSHKRKLEIAYKQLKRFAVLLEMAKLG